MKRFIDRILHSLKHANLFVWISAVMVFVVTALFLNAARMGHEARNDPNRMMPLAFEERQTSTNYINCLRDGRVYLAQRIYERNICPPWNRIALEVFALDRAEIEAQADFVNDRHRFISLYVRRGPKPEVAGISCSIKVRKSNPSREWCNLNYQQVLSCLGSQKAIKGYAEAYNRKLIDLGASLACER